MSTLAVASSAARPNTRATPAVGRTIPISTLMAVVLPAPLRPRNPKMDPRGTCRFSPDSASTSSYRFRSPTVSIAHASATMPSCSDHPGQLGLEQPPDLVVVQTALAQPL